MSAKDGYWFSLSHAYWLDGWFLTLDMPAKAMLLIALSLYNGFYLPFEQVKGWYGISRKTAQGGVKSLVGHALLDRNEDWIEEPMSDIGHRLEIRYTLRPPFGPHPDRTAAKTSSTAKRSAARRAPAKNAQAARKAAGAKAAVKKATTARSVAQKRSGRRGTSR